MKTLRLFLLLLMSSLMTPVCHAADGEMPIIAYMGIPDWHTTDEDFRVLSECGFNVSLYPYRSLDLLVKACRIADKYGVKVLAPCPEMTKNPVKAANTLKREKGFFGYMMKDEPTIDQLEELDSIFHEAVPIPPCIYQNPGAYKCRSDSGDRLL